MREREKGGDRETNVKGVCREKKRKSKLVCVFPSRLDLKLVIVLVKNDESRSFGLHFDDFFAFNW